MCNKNQNEEGIRRAREAISGTSLYLLIMGIADYWEQESCMGKPCADRLREAVKHHPEDSAISCPQNGRDIA